MHLRVDGLANSPLRGARYSAGPVDIVGLPELLDAGADLLPSAPQLAQGRWAGWLSWRCSAHLPPPLRPAPQAGKAEVDHQGQRPHQQRPLQHISGIEARQADDDR